MNSARSTNSSSSIALRFFAKLQEAVAKIAYPEEDRLQRVERVCGVDVAYSKRGSAAAAVVYDVGKSEAVETVVKHFVGRQGAYIPGFLFLREGPPLLGVLSELRSGFDVLLVDGHGRAHPRRCGIATLLGFVAGVASAGVAKSVLTGQLRPVESHYELVVDGDLLGLSDGKTIYSQGYGISFNDLRKIFSLFGGRYPEVLKMADRLSRKAVEKT
ncbi:MAG: endonuclease V [Candidatus Caldarchaeum sp.]|nr:endonuclease V [Candidatus Caldarchaeum sp.]